MVTLYAKGVERLIKPIQEDLTAMPFIEVPPLSAWLDGDQVDRYPYKKTYEEAKNDPIWIVHTSGTTGTLSPK